MDIKFSSAMTRIRNYFFTGLIVCAPLAITFYISWSFIGWVDSWVKPYLPERYNPDSYSPFAIPGLGLIVSFSIITLIGFLAANFIGRAILSLGEHILGCMPLVRGLYKTLKHIFETVLSKKSEIFRTVGLIEYPRKGIWSLVFLTGDNKVGINNGILDKPGDPLVSVFLPCAPNPTTGFLVYVRRSDIKILDISIEDTAKLLISAGLLTPEGSDSKP